MTAEDRFSVGLTATEVEGSCPAPPAGPPPNLGITSADLLYEIDLDHGTFRRLPDTGWGPFFALARSPDGRYFGLVSGDPIASTVLLEVEPYRGEVRFVDVTSEIARDLAFDPEGRLWLLSSTGQELLRVDPESGDTLQVSPWRRRSSGCWRAKSGSSAGRGTASTTSSTRSTSPPAL